MDIQATALLRKAALALHALSPDDQAWMLAQLDPQAQAQLQALLAELQSLGIPQEPTLIDVALQGISQAPVPEQPHAADWQGVPFDALAKALRDEPLVVKKACLSLLPADQARQVRLLLPDTALQLMASDAEDLRLTQTMGDALTSAWLQAARTGQPVGSGA